MLVLIDTVVNLLRPIQEKMVAIAYAQSNFHSHLRNYATRTDLKLRLRTIQFCVCEQ